MQSKWLLLQTASPAALIRLKSSSSLRSEVLGLNDIYFHHQCHSSLREFLSNKLIQSAPTKGLLIQVLYACALGIIVFRLNVIVSNHRSLLAVTS